MNEPLGVSTELQANNIPTLLQQAIALRQSEDGGYIDGTLRSPEITTFTFRQGIPDASWITLDKFELEYPQTGGKGVVLRGSAKGGIDGLRGKRDTEKLQELPVAVKVPFLNTAASLHTDDFAYVERYNATNILATVEEASVLEVIRQKQQELYPGTKLFVPNSVLVQRFQLSPDDARIVGIPIIPDAPAVVMEWVDGNDQISKQRNSLSADQMLSACIQFFELIDVIHQTGILGGDRKMRDVYYRADEDRLIVLDWNVTKTFKSPPQLKDIHALDVDLSSGIQIFGDVKYLGNRMSPKVRGVLESFKQKITSKANTAIVAASDIVAALQG